MRTMSEQVPYANYQYEIYLRGLGGQRPARSLDWRRLERDAYRLLAPEILDRLRRCLRRGGWDIRPLLFLF